MDSVYEYDQQWFALHPTTHQYQRAPLPAEWPAVDVPPAAVVTVHQINAHCTVRVLAIPKERRLAEAIDTDTPPPVVPAHPVPGERMATLRGPWFYWDLG